MTWANAIIWVVSADPRLRELLVTLLEAVGHRVQAHPRPRTLLDEYDPDQPGCLLFDLNLPDMSGLQLWQTLRERGSSHPFLVISGNADVSAAVASMHEGAVDFIEVPFPHARLFSRVEEALRCDALQRERRREAAEFRESFNSLTPREREVMEMVAEGMLTKQIARRLGISEKTVEVHRSHVTKKMHVKSVAQLVRMVTRHAMHTEPTRLVGPNSVPFEHARLRANRAHRTLEDSNRWLDRPRSGRRSTAESG